MIEQWRFKGPATAFRSKISLVVSGSCLAKITVLIQPRKLSGQTFDSQ